MAKSYYLPYDDTGRLSWLNNFAPKLPSYAAVLGLSAGDVTSVANDTAFFAYVVSSQQQMIAHAQQWTAYRNAVRDGNAADLGPVPVTLVLGVAPTAVAPGIISRVKAIVARIKVAPGYNDSIGQALQVVGAEQIVDASSLKPVLTVRLVAGQVVLVWIKQGMDGIEIHVDRGAGFVFLAIDSIPDYTDKQAMPAADQSALWKYKAIYIQADQRVGQWSDVVSIPVAG